MLISQSTILLGGLWQATDKIIIKMTILDLNEGVAGGNTPPKFYLVLSTYIRIKVSLLYKGTIAPIML